MPRKLHIPHSEYPYHVRARTHSGTWFNVPIESVWDIMTDYLFFIHHAYEVKIHSFVLMNNHFHLLVTTPNANLSEAMNYFMRETSKEINRCSGKKNQLYGNRHGRTLIEDVFYFPHVYKYVYRNPVNAGLSTNCEDYRYSTLHGLLGKTRLNIPLVEDKFLFENGNLSKALRWLNTPPDVINFNTLEVGLSKKVLKFPKNQWNTQKHTLDMHPY